jgi:hypothetical protein
MFMDLLSVIAGGSVFIAAFMEGRKAGSLGTLLGLVLGLALGFVTLWGTRTGLKWAVGRLRLDDPNPPPLRLALAWLLCLAALVATVLAMIAVSWLARHLTHLMR